MNMGWFQKAVLAVELYVTNWSYFTPVSSHSISCVGINFVTCKHCLLWLSLNLYNTPYDSAGFHNNVLRNGIKDPFSDVMTKVLRPKLIVALLMGNWMSFHCTVGFKSFTILKKKYKEFICLFVCVFY